MTATTAEIRPKALWYWVGGGLMVLGVVAAVVVFIAAFQKPLDRYREISDKIDSFQSFRVPGRARVTLETAGDVVIYVEGADDSLDSTVDLDPSSVTVESTEPDSTPLEVRSVPFTETLNFSGPSEQTSLEFTVDEPGQYLITVSEVPPGVTTIAVGPPLDVAGALKATALAILVPMGIGGLLVAGGAVVLIVTGVRRSGAARRLRMAAGPPPGAWTQPPPAAWPPGTGVGGTAPAGWGGPQPPPPAWPPPAGPAAPSAWPPQGGPVPGPIVSQPAGPGSTPSDAAAPAPAPRSGTDPFSDEPRPPQ